MGAKTDVIVKMVLVFFISLLSFSIGTFVGKKYSDNQHKLAALEPGKTEHGAREVASHDEHGAAAKEHGTAKADESMSDDEIAKLAEEFVADETTATGATTTGGHGEAKEAKHDEHAAAAEAPVAAAPKSRSLEKAEPLSAAKNLSHGKAITATAVEEKKVEKDARVPSSIPKDVTQYSSGKFTVQIGAYAKEEEAQKIAGDLKSKGFSAFYIPATIKGQTWFRVSVGLFATPKEAQTYRTELMTKAKLSSALVQKIVQ